MEVESEEEKKRALESWTRSLKLKGSFSGTTRPVHEQGSKCGTCGKKRPCSSSRYEQNTSSLTSLVSSKKPLIEQCGLRKGRSETKS